MTRATLLQNGLVIDGTGAEGWIGDVLLMDGRIAALGENLGGRLPSGLAPEEVAPIDCTGLAIAPGFIDVHTHDDAIVLKQPDMLPKVSQGITTVITGNCGISLLPFIVEKPEPPLNLLGADSFRFDSIPSYERAIAQAQPAVNVAVLIGHTTLRFACMGDLTCAASASELDVMCALLTQCMESGATGMSSGLFTNRPLPRRQTKWCAWPRWCRALAGFTAPTCAMKWRPSWKRCTRRAIPLSAPACR